MTLPKTFTGEVETEITSVTNLSMTKEGNILMTVKFSHTEMFGITEAVPFLATPDDATEYGPWLHSEALKGSFGEVAPYERPDVTVEDLQAEFDKIWPDVMLGLADQATIDLAKNLRVQIKAMS